jgi:hypothetical protein
VRKVSLIGHCWCSGAVPSDEKAEQIRRTFHRQGQALDPDVTELARTRGSVSCTSRRRRKMQPLEKSTKQLVKAISRLAHERDRGPSVSRGVVTCFSGLPSL